MTVPSLPATRPYLRTGTPPIVSSSVAEYGRKSIPTTVAIWPALPTSGAISTHGVTLVAALRGGVGRGVAVTTMTVGEEVGRGVYVGLGVLVGVAVGTGVQVGTGVHVGAGVGVGTGMGVAVGSGVYVGKGAKGVYVGLGVPVGSGV